tara:strand:- start:2730 stop:3200 length:471 start_codon:yes stop_codon:yes gene_type:complete
MSNIENFKNKFNNHKKDNISHFQRIQKKNDLNNETQRINNEIDIQNNNIIIKSKEDEIKNQQELTKIQQEKELELKLQQWILEENKGEDELLKHLNNSPEQFQHVDSLFFNSNMNRLFNLQKIQREQKKNQYINAYQKKNIVKNNNPITRFSMKLF